MRRRVERRCFCTRAIDTGDDADTVRTTGTVTNTYTNADRIADAERITIAGRVTVAGCITVANDTALADTHADVAADQRLARGRIHPRWCNASDHRGRLARQPYGRAGYEPILHLYRRSRTAAG
jgi:hypothetical protein